MGRQDIEPDLSPEAARRFTRALLEDLRALEQILERGLIEEDCHRIGAEQEMFLVDKAWRPAPVALEVLDRLHDPRCTTELARFNLETNLSPCDLGGDCFRRVEAELRDVLGNIAQAARESDASVVLTGILPSLSKSDLTLDNITPYARYHALNEATTRLRGGAPYRLRLEGADSLDVEHDSVMLEAANTSFQVHLQVGATDFARFYNVAQAISAPVLAASVNSPLLFGKRLWRETRIALFQQSIDTQIATPHLRDHSPRVRFGNRWIENSVLELFQEDVARFPVLIAMPINDNPFEALDAGQTPPLSALGLHNSTVYSWNRPCYGVHNGVPHLRIECRYIAAGPSVLDEMANAAFWVGCMLGGAKVFHDVPKRLDFDDAKANFVAAGRYGLKAGFTWFDNQAINAQELILDVLLPIAREGLLEATVDEDDVTRLLNIIEGRVSTGRTGAWWLVHSFQQMKAAGTSDERLVALTAATADRQGSGRPVHEWETAKIDEAGDSRELFSRVEQFMVTDLFTVSEDELVDRVAFLMDRKQLRQVLIEDAGHGLVGIVSYRSLVRLLAEGGARHNEALAVKEIMSVDPLSVAPETPTMEAIELMREHRVSALPVLKDGKLVGLVTEQSFMNVAKDLLENRLRGL
jgi:CBS domain-containing protein